MSMRKIAFVGDAQAAAVAALYRDLIGSARDEHVACYRWQGELPLAFARELSAFDVVCVQDAGFGNVSPDRGNIMACEIHRFPRLLGMAYWPFHTDTIPPPAEIMPDIRRFPDRYLQSLIAQDVEPYEAVKAYLALDIEAVIRCADPMEAMLDRYRAIGEATGITLSSFIEEAFADEQLFRSPAVPSPRLLAAMAAQFFAQLGASASQLERTAASRPRLPTAAYELPVHPALAERFGLRFLNEDTQYRLGHTLTWTFAEYVEAYLRGASVDAFPEGSQRASPSLATLILGLPDAPATSAPDIPSKVHSQLARDAGAAARLLEALCRDRPAWIEAWELLAEARRRAGDASGASEAAERAVALAPDRAVAWRLLGLARHAMRDFEAAEQATLAEVRADLLSADAHNLLAEVREELGHRATAISGLSDARKLGAFNAQTFSLLGNFHLRDGDLDLAEDTFRLGADLDPGRDDLRQGVADVRHQIERRNASNRGTPRDGIIGRFRERRS